MSCDHHRSSRPNATCFAILRSLTCASGIEVQIKTKLWKSFEGKGEKNAILLLIAGVVPHHGAEGGDPVRQITIDRVALFLENPYCAFVLLLKSETPIIV